MKENTLKRQRYWGAGKRAKAGVGNPRAEKGWLRKKESMRETPWIKTILC